MAAEIPNRYGYFVDGEPRQPNRNVSVRDPSTNEEIATIPEAGPRGVDAALESAVAVENEWRAHDAVERGHLLRALADRIREDADRLAATETMEVGRPLSESHDNVEGAAGLFEYYAGLTDKIEGRQIPLANDGSYLDYTLREPYGTTAQVVPWNASIALAARGFAPALAAGNTVVAKAPSRAPLSLLELTKLAHEVGFPAGVVNTVTGSGSGTGDPLVTDDRVDAIEFTGSTTTGKNVMQSAAEHVSDVHLELGGKGANIVFEDADLEGAVASVIETFNNAGQICFAPTRLFVQSGVYDDFLDRVVARVEAMEVGPGIADPDMGPVISPSARDTVAEFVEDARRQGGRVLTGGEVPREPGNFYAPTLIAGVDDDARVSCEEVFGPVITVYEFDTPEEAVERANDTRYGLSNLVWTTDLATAHSVAGSLESGTVQVNDYPVLSPAAVSGGYKESGLGRAKGMQAIETFTQSKNVAISLDGVL
ncbi:aldehyde dehydrogenase family protein [Salinirussus salinus]|uniref:aldehyde dehydrogenase family protein n=1 Tax=Salinirussus salinus TaxID=1198300 RepID=UPI00135AE942|nr:aldehyde dehydrogenase family protein [Salinirussus salinus]